ncbi:glycerophosphodiester phosphodiesterase family protein, partial [Roseicella aquatilis]
RQTIKVLRRRHPARESEKPRQGNPQNAPTPKVLPRLPVERIPELRPDNTAYDGQSEIPTLDEVISLVKQVEADTGRKIGIIPETKHPTYFAEEGLLLDGTPIHHDTSRMLVDDLVEAGFTDPDRVIIQSFELENLIRLQTEIMPRAHIDVPLIQLPNEGGYDIVYNFDPSKSSLGANSSVYKDFNFPLSAESATNGDLYMPAALRAMHDLYAELIGPYKDDILPTRTVDPPVDGNGDGKAEVTRELTGAKSSLVEDAHKAGLDVIIYTLRDEEVFASLSPDGTPRPTEQEYRDFIATGVDGFFTDFPGTGRRVVGAVTREHDLAPHQLVECHWHL